MYSAYSWFVVYIFTRASKLLNATCTVVVRLDWTHPKNVPHRQEDKVTQYNNNQVEE